MSELQKVEEKVEGEVERLESELPVGFTTSAPGLLPGELVKHPNPAQYVVIAVILVIVTALEVGVSYLDGDIPDWLIIVLLVGMALIKFVTVASWYMHLRTDQPIFKRFFILGCVAAVILYTIVLATLGAIT